MDTNPTDFGHIPPLKLANQNGNRPFLDPHDVIRLGDVLDVDSILNGQKATES
jgi:hypothetical protein